MEPWEIEFKRNAEPTAAWARRWNVVAIDLRGYNKSDQPKGVENYAIDKLVGYGGVARLGRAG